MSVQAPKLPMASSIQYGPAVTASFLTEGQHFMTFVYHEDGNARGQPALGHQAPGSDRMTDSKAVQGVGVLSLQTLHHMASTVSQGASLSKPATAASTFSYNRPMWPS